MTTAVQRKTFSMPKLAICLAAAFGLIALLHDYDPPVVPDVVVAPAIAVFGIWVARAWSRGDGQDR